MAVAKAGGSLKSSPSYSCNWIWASGLQDAAALGTVLERSEQVAIHIQDASPWQAQAMLSGYQGTGEANPWESLLGLIEETWKCRAGSIDLLLTYDPSLPADWPHGELRDVAEDIWLHVQNGGGLSAVRLVTRPNWKRFLRGARIASGKPKVSEHFDALHRAASECSSRTTCFPVGEANGTPRGNHHCRPRR